MSSHVRKDTMLFPLFHTARDGKLGGVWVRGQDRQKVDTSLEECKNGGGRPVHFIT